jgi:acyl-CoA synthetase (AMP-forming)/AMP-acid ligase II
MTPLLKHPIQSSRLPCLTVLSEDGSATRVDVAGNPQKVRGCADRILRMAEPGSNVGICFRSSPDLIWWWFGALLAGMRPLIMQYPTGRQAHSYWESSVSDTIRRADLNLLVCDDLVSKRLGASYADKLISEPVPESADTSPFSIERFSIIQLSSGTTGLRKAVEFTSESLVRHALDYNTCLKLTKKDTIVSWLPLYHDMGYIACFMMPLILGVPVVMMDSEYWVNDKALLFRAITEHSGTVCFMPNFGFEVMCGITPTNLKGMRLWISCSEPVLEHTSRKFLKHIGAKENHFAACYAMAENIFAMTQSTGITTRHISGMTVVSCGKPIKDVEIKCIDGELWVRSPTSITSYMSQESIIDEDGYYPTGDLGEIIDGEIYVTGRKRDLMIQAGKKHILSAIDDIVNQVVPEARGRVATLEDHDERLATSKAVVLIESRDFFLRSDQREIARNISERSQLEYLEVHFVPPRFLTKTSSGKINRPLSLKHWKAVCNARNESHSSDPSSEIRAEFRQLPFDQPVGRILDSLATTVLRIILADTGISFDPEMTLGDYVSLAETPDQAASDSPNGTEGLRIVSLADRRILKHLKEDHIRQLTSLVDSPVHFEHTCLPPSPILLSDLIFLDYFLPRLDHQEDFSAMLQVREKLRSASLLLVDDAAELHFSIRQFYPVLSHRFVRSADADLLAFRWQSYTRNHDKLPITVVAGEDLDLADRDKSLNLLSSYLGIPIVRIATVSSLEPYTKGWEYPSRQSLSGGPGLRPIDPVAFVKFLSTWVAEHSPKSSQLPANTDFALSLDDLPHFCSHFVDQEALDIVLDSYQRFCIAGSRASVAYIRRKLDEDPDKSYCHITTPSRTAIEAASPHDCVLVCGPTIEIDHSGPVACVMGGSRGPVMLNASDKALRDLRFRGKSKSCQPDEWFHLSGISGQTTNTECIHSATKIAQEKRETRRKIRETRSSVQESRADCDSIQSTPTPIMSNTDNRTEQDRKAQQLERRKEERRESRRAERREERKAGRLKEGKPDNG